MKRSCLLSLVFGLALLVPSMALAQPGHPQPGQPGQPMMAPGQPGHPGQPGPGPNAKPKPNVPHAQPGPNNHGPAPAPGKPGPGPMKPAPAPAPHHGPAPAPAPHHGPAPAPAPHHGPAPVPPPPVVVHPAPVPPPPPAPQIVMNHQDFARLLRSIDRAPFKADKLARVQSAAATNRFSSQQAKELLTHLNFDSDRVKAACSLYPSVVDAANWHIVYEALSYSSSHAQVRHCSR